MKILLDECVTKHLKRHLSQFEVWKVRETHWSGIKNGKLLSLCADRHFDILLTIDKNLQHQQNLDKYPVTVVVLKSFTSDIDELITYLPSFLQRLSEFEKHKACMINK